MLKSFHQQQIALGGDVNIVLVGDTSRDIDNIFSSLWRMIYRFERQFSRFLPDSELSRLNKSAGIDFVASSELIAILQASQRLSRRTGGLYNPFILPALQRAGYKNSAQPGYEEDQVDDFSNRSVVSADRLKIKGSIVTIPYGTALDLGGCGKGYLADQLHRELQKMNLKGYWISLSGDIISWGRDEQLRPWQISVQKLSGSQNASYIQGVGKLLGIATSGTARRPNQTSRSDWHHIIDPRTGLPTETDIRLSTVVATSCLEADVLASCAIILGRQKALPFLKRQGVLAALLQTDSGTTAFGHMIQKTQKKEVPNVA